MTKDFPLATRELLIQLRALFMPSSPADFLACLNLPDAERLALAGKVDLVATLINNFEQEHGKL